MSTPQYRRVAAASGPLWRKILNLFSDSHTRGHQDHVELPSMSVFVFVCSSAYCPFSSNYIHMQCPFRPLYIYIFSILYQTSAQFFLFSKNKNKKSARKPFAAGHKNLKCPQIHVRWQKFLAACTNQTRELDSAVRERLAVIKQG